MCRRRRRRHCSSKSTNRRPLRPPSWRFLLNHDALEVVLNQLERISIEALEPRPDLGLLGLQHLLRLHLGLCLAEQGIHLGGPVLVVGAHVPPGLVQPVEVLSAELALVHALDVVRPAVLGQVRRLAEPLVANLTLERLVPRVCAREW